MTFTLIADGKGRDNLWNESQNKGRTFLAQWIVWEREEGVWRVQGSKNQRKREQVSMMKLKLEDEKGPDHPGPSWPGWGVRIEDFIPASVRSYRWVLDSHRATFNSLFYHLLKLPLLKLLNERLSLYCRNIVEGKKKPGWFPLRVVSFPSLENRVNAESSEK